MNQPIYLTEEEIQELNQLWKDYHGQSPSSGWDKWRDSDWMYDYDDEGFSNHRRQKHEWLAVVLLNHTVYDCKHCGAHKDKARSDFCDDETMF
jgi:hypothetical protein